MAGTACCYTLTCGDDGVLHNVFFLRLFALLPAVRWAKQVPADENPAVQLYQLVMRMVRQSSSAFTGAERKELRGLLVSPQMLWLEIGRREVDTSLKLWRKLSCLQPYSICSAGVAGRKRDRTFGETNPSHIARVAHIPLSSTILCVSYGVYLSLRLVPRILVSLWLRCTLGRVTN